MKVSRIFCFLILIAGCTGPAHTSSVPKLTPEIAKAALITLAINNPAAFEDFPPDPELLKGLPVLSDENGKLQFGAFTIDSDNLRYSADIEWRGGIHSFSGDFVYADGKWLAAPPELLRFHNPR